MLIEHPDTSIHCQETLVSVFETLAFPGKLMIREAIHTGMGTKHRQDFMGY